MGNARRELLGAGALVLDVRGCPGPPPLRFEVADGGRMLLRQSERAVLLGRVEEWNQGVYVSRYDGYRPPLPPIGSALMRNPANWVHTYAGWLAEAREGPLHDSRWLLGARSAFPPYVWHGEDFVRAWPHCHLDWSAAGWHGVVPLRPLSPEDAPRVKAYRKHARDGTLAPVLLWWVTALDGWLLLDGHDRAVAALAEGLTPPCVVLTRVPEEEDWRHTADEVTDSHEARLERLAARPAAPGIERQRETMLRAYADTLSSLPYEPARTRSWPLPGGAPAWDALAAAAMFQFPRD
ncbi:hypothetical protein SRB17_08710 [Streptomyces sp. RB17]|uniref:hypothetical protein n=1 Tax=Streptomyces sp. RB17 TaxID=2585197 RepID=UPI001308FB4B|nr:hypothetical protein [Streptomyces sp. RB17]MQY32911.1 hypothetical protein [Streptomyces sp. RB17]